MNQNTIKVLLADDNKDFCDIIVDHLNKQEDITVVAVAMDGIDAMNKIRDTHPDVAVIDGIMPRLDGLGVLERLQKTEEDDRPITIILSALSQDKVVQKALDLGASYYMVKPFDAKEVVARIKAVLRRCQTTTAAAESTEGVIEFDNLRLDMNSYELRVKGKVVEAPPKELELLNCLASHPNRVYTRDQLLDEVWGFEYYGDSRTIDVHVKRLREKLAGASDKWELKTVWGVGYKFEVRQ